MWIFQQKLKRLAYTLNSWSRRKIGYIYANAKDFDETTRVAERELITNNTEENRTKFHGLNAQYIRFLKLEDSMLGQKAQLHWFKEGDMKIKYFNVLIRGRTRKLHIHRNQNEQGDWLQGDETIAKASCEHLHQIFTGKDKAINEEFFECLPTLVINDQNGNLQNIPTMEELKNVIFSMNPESATRPDRTNGRFHQFCWDIISRNSLHMVHGFSMVSPCQKSSLMHVWFYCQKQTILINQLALNQLVLVISLTKSFPISFVLD